MPYYAVEIESQTFTMNTRYRIIRKVGSGAYGTVCSAFDFQNKRHCAIKKISRVFDKRLIAKRCLREIKLLQHFNGHPHIIDLLDMDIVDTAHFNDIYLVFNCMDASLHDVIHSEQPLDPIHAQWFLYQMLSGLKFIHDAEVIHRDMKPANILVNRDCDLKICDFGMARSYRETDETDTMTEYVTTRWYRAPEVMISHQNYSKLIDIWSVGCIFGEILGRKVLFKGRSYVDQLHTILAMLGLPRDISFWDPSDTIETHLRGLCTVDGQPPPEHAVDFSTLFPQCPPEGIDLLETMLDLDPSHRITADEALDHPYLGIFAQSAVPTPMPKICDFSFEQGYDEQDLRRMIANEVIFFRLRAKAQETMGNMSLSSPPFVPHQDRSNQPRRHYTTTTLTTKSPIMDHHRFYNMPSATMSVFEQGCAMVTEATNVMGNGLVGEQEELARDDTAIEDDMRNTAGIVVDRARQFMDCSNNKTRQQLERALSGTF